MILADSSAWIDFFRKTGTPAHLELHRILDAGEALAVSEIVVGELLAGLPSGPQLASVRDRLLALPMLSLNGLDDFELAAWIFRTCRDAGHTFTTLTDCIVAAPALRTGVPVLHNDTDFDVMERVVGLRIHRR